MKQTHNHLKYFEESELDSLENRVIVDVKGAATEEEVVTEYYNKLNLPIHSSNWDALDEGLGDCSWVAGDTIRLVNTGLPSMDDEELAIFVAILEGKSKFHGVGPTAEMEHPQRKIDFQVYFPESAREKIEELMNRH
jgi:hypothetical protein